MRLIDCTALPPAPLDAAAAFYRDMLPDLPEAGDCVLVFAAGDRRHAAWRRAALGELARIRAPLRINATAGGGEAAQAAALAYLAAAPGVTGQVLALDDRGAGPVLGSAR